MSNEVLSNFVNDRIEMRPPETMIAATQSIPSARTIPDIFQAQARHTPHAVAVKCADQQLTYQQLNERANQLAHHLRQFGLGPEKMAAVYMDRSLETVVAILAILKAGGAYVPIDLAYPPDRVAFMLQDAGVVAVLTQSEHRKALDRFTGPIVAVDTDQEAIAAQSKTDPEISLNPDQAAYVIYTSGSTGKPKGVVVTQDNVVRLFSSTDSWYHFSASDVWTLFHSFAFDFSVWEIWGALFYGGKLIVVPYYVSRSPEAFYRLLSDEKVTVLNQTPSAFRQLIWAEDSAPTRLPLSLRYVIFGGEALELQSLRPWFARHGDQTPRLVNMYGITETTVHVTYRPITTQDVALGLGSVIGEPIPDLSIQLLDENGQPCPVGVPGEMHVGGAGLARGYLNRPELSAEKFIRDPFSPVPGARLYRSGDLAKRLPSGDLEYLGRIDHQVKIRGFRIELGEIETGLNSHPQVRESAVLALKQPDGGQRLVAYIVSKTATPTVDDLRDFLAAKVPAYMVPSAFVFLDAFPLTINGKIDRRALPSPEQARPDLKKEYVAPSTPEEKILAAIWQECLQIDQAGVHDNFFELGGDSIRSIQVLSRAQKSGLHISLQALFEKPTIFELARSADVSSTDTLPAQREPFANISAEDRAKLPAGVEDAYPMAQLQTGMVFHSDYDPQSAIFHDVFSFRMTIPYQVGRLEEAIQRLVDRHTIFRTALDLTNFSQPLQLVYKNVTAPFSAEDLRAVPPAQQKEKLVAWVDREKRHRFDWSRPPMMRLHVQRYSDETFQFIVSFHHTIMDGWSLAAMLTELFQDYDALLKGSEAVIAAPAVTYRDFVHFETQAIQSTEARDYWRRKLANPTIHSLPRWPEAPRRGGREQVRGPEIFIPQNVFAGLKQLANSAGVPIRSVLLAAHCQVMSFLTGQTDMITGLVANGRPQTADGEKLIGLFLNTLPLRLQLDGGTWKDLVRQTFAAERELIPHRRVPLSEIQQIAGGKALFETTFDFVQFHVYRDLPGYKDHSFLEDHYFEANNFNFFVTFMVDAAAAELQMHFDYNPNEFCDEQIALICDYFSNTLAAMAAHPGDRYETNCPLPEKERQRLLVDWNQTRREFPDCCVHDLFEAQAARTPAATAAQSGEHILTYAALNQRADYLAHHLLGLGVQSESIVAIQCERSLDMLVAVLGTLKAGATYLPMDPAYPAERLDFMLQDAEVKILLTDRPDLEGSHPARKVVGLEGVLAKMPEQFAPSRQPSRRPAPGDVAYMIYTSGSTGKPKGVQIPHRAVVNFLHSMQREPGLQPSDRLLAVTTLSFDISVLELLLPLTVGATVVIAPSATALDPSLLAQTIEGQSISVMQATPTTWRALLDSGWTGKKAFKALCGGESLSADLARKLTSACGEVWNMYGPTETTIWSTTNRLEPASRVVSIGRPIDNTTLYILNSGKQLVPTGAEGEIYLGGAGLARGYYHRPELTAERFTAHPFEVGQKLYRTGDVGRRLHDGRVLCAGRTDHQVKIRGHRIELGEIETALNTHSGVAASVVVARPNLSGGLDQLVAYFVPRDPAPGVSELRASLEKKLPGYMVPSLFVALTSLPLTPNGKIDRSRLPAPEHKRPELDQPLLAPRTPLEEALADAWKEVLKLEQIGIQDNFFELGGHSLLAVQVIARLRKCLDADLTIASFFEHPTIESFALFLMRQMVEQSEISDQELDTILTDASAAP